MLTQQQYSNVVYTASRANASLVQQLRARESLGSYPNWYKATIQDLKIQSGFWSLGIADYSSEASVDIYNQLLDIGSTWSGGISFDPNAQIPGVIVVGVAVISGYNETTIPFSTSGGSPAFVLSNYQTLYAPFFGNNPNTLDVYTTAGGEQKDEQTAPIINRVNPSDINSAIIDITWPYPIATQGYVLLGGIGTGGSSGGGSGGGSGATTLTFTEADLLQDGSGSWYIPLTIPANRIPVGAISNGETVTIDFNDNFTPNRLYGFANNDTQAITVKTI